MMISTICIIAAMAMNMLLAASNYRTIRGYIIFDRLDIHCEIQAVPFKQLSEMQPGEPSAAIRERVIDARNIQTERFSHLPQGGRKGENSYPLPLGPKGRLPKQECPNVRADATQIC